MSTVDPTQATASSTVASAAPTIALENTTLDYDAFLKLLVAQMENQDPLEPVSDTEYIAQLATFSNVEQNIKSNELLTELLLSSTLSDAHNLIGRTVSAADGRSGTVESVQIIDSQINAKLDSGEVVILGDGVTVS